jgi:hypothetical protein
LVEHAPGSKAMQRERLDDRPSGTAPATSHSAVDSGKILFRFEKSPCRHRKASSNQWLETILARPADSRNSAPFGTVGSGPAVELRRGFEIAEFGILGMGI